MGSVVTAAAMWSGHPSDPRQWRCDPVVTPAGGAAGRPATSTDTVLTDGQNTDAAAAQRVNTNTRHPSSKSRYKSAPTHVEPAFGGAADPQGTAHLTAATQTAHLKCAPGRLCTLTSISQHQTYRLVCGCVQKGSSRFDSYDDCILHVENGKTRRKHHRHGSKSLGYSL